MAVTDLAKSLLTVIETNWLSANMDRKFTPTFDLDWTKAGWSAERRVSVRELRSTHRPEDLCNSIQVVERMFQIDVFAMDRDDALDMREEVDRIINAKNSEPFTGVSYMLQTSWEDLTGSFGDYSRYACTIMATSFVNG